MKISSSNIRSIIMVFLGVMLFFWGSTKATAGILDAVQPNTNAGEDEVVTDTPTRFSQFESMSNRSKAGSIGKVTPTVLAFKANSPKLGLISSSPTAVPTEKIADLADLNGYLALAGEKDQVKHTGAANIPDRIVIPSINLDAPVIHALSHKVKVGGVLFEQWVAPDQKSGGWQGNSAYLGELGNTVINGHHNYGGEVFKYLVKVEPGDHITVFSNGNAFEYVVTQVMILPERDAGIQAREQNARWISRSDDERLTLVTCWPYVSNTHRLIVVASPYTSKSLDTLR